MTGQRIEASPLAMSRRRAEALRDRHPFAEEMLGLYLALLDVWEEAWDTVRADEPADLAGWAATRVLPKVTAVTAEHGPEPLANAVRGAFATSGDAVRGAFGAGSSVARGAFATSPARELLAAWLGGVELVPLERYLARATLRGPLLAVEAGVACAEDPAPRGDRRCPRCGGLPQLSFRTETGDRLVSGRRQLQCARCGENWSFSGCAHCGAAQRTVHAEHQDGPHVGRPDANGATFPHVRVEACAACDHYLIDIDLGRDPRAVPEVDELAALPLDLYAAEHGLTKITPNLMGF